MEWGRESNISIGVDIINIKHWNRQQITMNNKQTAVEWLVEQYYTSEGKLTGKDFEHALNIECQQTINFANNYGFDVCGYDYEGAEQYYNKTCLNDGQ